MTTNAIAPTIKIGNTMSSKYFLKNIFDTNAIIITAVEAFDTLFQNIIFFISVYQVAVFLDSSTSYYPEQQASFYLRDSCSHHTRHKAILPLQ